VQKTVLVVEDEFLIAMDLKLMLEERGWRVIGPVATVQDALRLLEETVEEGTVVRVLPQEGPGKDLRFEIRPSPTQVPA